MTHKTDLTRNQLIKLLEQHKYVKADVASYLNVDEKSIRRACKRLQVDVELEKKSKLASHTPLPIKVAKTASNSEINKGSFVAVPDLHDVTVSWPYMNAVCNFIRDFKPEYLIQIGDLLDYECLMSKVKTKYPAFDGKDLKSLDTGFEAAGKILSMLNQATSKSTKKIMLKGNHEFRADLILKNYPEFDTVLNFKNRLQMTDWDVLEYLVPIKLGRLNFIHGEFYGNNHVAKHLKHYQKNVMYGHTHQVCQDTMSSPMRQIPIWGASIGCGCDLNPDYQRNKSNNWQHGFGFGWFNEKVGDEGGDFDAVVKRVINHSFHAEGRKYCG